MMMTDIDKLCTEVHDFNAINAHVARHQCVATGLFTFSA